MFVCPRSHAVFIPKASATSSRVEETLHTFAYELSRFETSNWTVGAALAGWADWEGFAAGKPVEFPVGPVCLIIENLL
jgi:hypothetical protein